MTFLVNVQARKWGHTQSCTLGMQNLIMFEGQVRLQFLTSIIDHLFILLFIYSNICLMCIFLRARLAHTVLVAPGH